MASMSRMRGLEDPLRSAPPLVGVAATPASLGGRRDDRGRIQCMALVGQATQALPLRDGQWHSDVLVSRDLYS